MSWTIALHNFQTLKGRKSAYLDWSWLKPDAQIICFSKSNLISSCAIRLWLQNYQKSVATPCALTSCATDSQEQSPTVRYWGNIVLFLSSVLWQQPFFTVKLCSNRVICSYFPSFLLPSLPEAFLLAYCSFHFLYPPNAPLFLSFSFHLPSLYPFLPSLPPCMLAVWFSEVTKGSVSLGLCEAVSSWCNYDGWSNFQRRLSPRGLSPPCFLSALMTF